MRAKVSTMKNNLNLVKHKLLVILASKNKNRLEIIITIKNNHHHRKNMENNNNNHRN